MPRPRRIETASRTIVASARRYTGRSPALIRPQGSRQERCYHHYENNGTARYTAKYYGHALSRTRLFVEAPDGTPTAEWDSQIAELAQTYGTEEFLEIIGTHLVIGGECFLVDLGTGWKIYSPLEVTPGPQWRVRDEQGNWMVVPKDASIIRIWTPSPRFQEQPDSMFMSMLPLLEEIEFLSRYIHAQSLSRLSGAGILLVPDGMSFPPPQPVDGKEVAYANEADEFMQVLGEEMLEPVKDPSSPAATVPLVVSVPGDLIDNVRHVTFWTELDANAREMRQDAIHQFALGADLPPEMVLGMSSNNGTGGGRSNGVNHWCVPEQTEALTRTGWKTHHELAIGEDVYTLDHETGLAEWQPVEDIYRAEVDQEEMVRLKGRRHDSLTTLGHRWPILHGAGRHRRWITSGEFAEALEAELDQDRQRHDYLTLGAPSASLPQEPKYQDELVELVAWYATEGSVGLRPGRRSAKVVIHQSQKVNPDKVARIQRSLTALFGPESDLGHGGRFSTPDQVQRHSEILRLHGQGMSVMEVSKEVGVSKVTVYEHLKKEPKIRDPRPRWTRKTAKEGEMVEFRLNGTAGDILTEIAPRRIVDPGFVLSLTTSQLELFIDTCIQGDGTYMHGLTPVYSQKDPEALEAFVLACVLSGRSVMQHEHKSIGRSATGPRAKVQQVATASDRSLTFSPRGRSVSRETYTGTIWCPTTGNGTWLARNNGTVFFTGNSGWQLEEQAIKLHVEPMLGAINHALSVNYLEPLGAPVGTRLRGDTSTLRLRPDRSKESVELYDRGQLKGSVMIRENGFSPDEMMDAEEYRQWLLRKVATGSATPEQVGAALDALGVDLGDVEGENLRETRPDPSLDDHPDRPRTPEAGLLTYEALVLRALERAGNRLRNIHQVKTPGPAYEAHVALSANSSTAKCLEDAWSTAEIILDGHSDPGRVVETLNGYCSSLLINREPHTREGLATWCEKAGI